jgi:hypothetical protein
MHAGVRACDRQSRLCRRLDRRRSRRPSSAVPPVCPAAHARRSNICARVRLRVDATSCVCARCAMVINRASVRLRVCVRACVWVRARACASVCVGPPVARRGPAVFIDRRPSDHVCALRLSPRSGRRRDVDEPYVDCAVGCAIWAHVRDRRRRRHLRHRRPQRHHLLQRRVDQHRRRCATDLGGWSGGTGALRVLAGYLGVPRGFVGE